MNRFKNLIKGGSSSNSMTEQDQDLYETHNKRELRIAQIEQKLLNWNIPKVANKQIYETGFGDLFKHDYVIETTEKALTVNPSIECIELLKQDHLDEFKRKFRFVHIGLVQVIIKPLHRLGLDSLILMCLRDARFTSFIDSMLVVCESNLANGSIYFNCYPNYSVDLYDKNITKTLTLNMKIPTTMMTNSKNVVIIYRIHYKIMTSNLCPKAKIESSKNSTMLIEANFDKTNMQVSKLLEWSSITYLTEWQIENITPPKTITPRTQPIEIQESDKGSATIVFGNRKTRFGNILTRYSVSGISGESSRFNRSSTLRGVDWKHIIPKPLYDNKSDSPPISPTPSDMIPSENTNNTQYDQQL